MKTRMKTRKIIYSGPTPVKFFPATGIKIPRLRPTDVPEAFGEQLIAEDPERYRWADPPTDPTTPKGTTKE